MSYSDLLERMQSKDTEAFLEMTERYGWSVYSVIRETYSDTAVVDKVYDETMNAFYHSLANSSTEDPLEAILCGFADRISPEKLEFNQPLTENKNVPPKLQLFPDIQTVKISRTAGRKRGIRRFLGVISILLGIIMVLWFLAALLMEQELIPYYDFGYSWYYANIVQLFR